MSRYRFLQPENGKPGMMWDGDRLVTAEYLTPAQARNRQQFWSRKREIDLLERLRAEAAESEVHGEERGA